VHGDATPGSSELKHGIIAQGHLFDAALKMTSMEKISWTKGRFANSTFLCERMTTGMIRFPSTAFLYSISLFQTKSQEIIESKERMVIKQRQMQLKTTRTKRLEQKSL
jgi:hypothetical protein